MSNNTMNKDQVKQSGTTCGDCKFYGRPDDGGDDRTCYLNPPVIISALVVEDDGIGIDDVILDASRRPIVCGDDPTCRFFVGSAK